MGQYRMVTRLVQLNPGDHTPLKKFIKVDRMLGARDDPDLRDFLTIMVYQAPRRSELCLLRVGAADLEARTVTVIGKGDKEETIPIVEATLDIFRRRARCSGTPRLTTFRC